MNNNLVIEFNKNNRLLVLAANVDDDVLGCYGLLDKVKNLYEMRVNHVGSMSNSQTLIRTCLNN